MNVVQYSDLSIEDKKTYIRNCLLDGVEVHYRTRFGFIFIKNDELYADFYDEVSALDKYNMRFIMFSVANKFAHIEVYESDVLVKTLLCDVYDKDIGSLAVALERKYPNHTFNVFISQHKKDYRKCLSNN